MFRIAWRLQRVGLIGMSAFGVLFGLIQAAAYRTAAGSTAASRSAFGHQMETLGRSFTALLPLPVRVDTVSGYIQWRVFGALPMLFAVWALLAASGATRGDEDRGLIDEWLTSRVGRVRYLATRLAAFAAAAAIAVAATSASIDLAVVATGFSLDVLAVVKESAVLLALTLCCYAIVLAVSQFAGRRASAAGAAGAVLTFLFFVNSFSRTNQGLRPIASVLSPFYDADRSTPLTPGGALDIAAFAVLLIATAVLAALAAWLMTVRDIGSPVVKRRERRHTATYRPSPNLLLRLPVLSSLYEQRMSLLAWTVGAAIGAAYTVSIAHSLVDLVKQPGSFHAYLSIAGSGNPYVALTGYFWFGIFQLVLVAFALVRVAAWASDDNEGRLEMQLSAPVSRGRVLGERAAAFLLGAVVIIAGSSAAFYLSALAGNIGVHLGDLVMASLALLPFVLSFAAVGAVLISRVPRAAIGVLALLAFISYLITEGGPLLKAPDWVMKLSAFSLYGTPLTSGLYWAGLWILLGVTVAGFALASALMQRREVGR